MKPGPSSPQTRPEKRIKENIKKIKLKKIVIAGKVYFIRKAAQQT